MDIKEKLQRFKEKAQLFLENKTRTFIVDINHNYYFCDILDFNDDSVFVQGFAGRRKFEKDRILFLDILRFEEYEEREAGE